MATANSNQPLPRRDPINGRAWQYVQRNLRRIVTTYLRLDGIEVTSTTSWSVDWAMREHLLKAEMAGHTRRIAMARIARRLRQLTGHGRNN